MLFGRNGHRSGPALVLSGGGSMGALQAGILRVLIARGLQPSRIVGTSVGALNGAFLAFHPGEEGLERLAQAWRALGNERYIRANPVRVAYRLASRQRCLFSNDFLGELIAEHMVEDDFAAARVPLHVTATNLTTGKKRVFSEGPISQAVLASTAIPGVFAPIEIDGESYIDGGVVAHLDLDTAVDEGSKEILAIDLSHCFEETEPKSAIGVISRTVDIVMRDHVERDMARLRRKARITLIQPEIREGHGVGDLSQATRLLELGETLAEQFAEQCFDSRGRLRPGVVSATPPLPAEQAS
ncbi:MAG: patatin-like phospholipase family protein [Chloroflexi bacterium]|nr:patatin-like phospholipase family protein [Chloroflexota bacterium]